MSSFLSGRFLGVELLSSTVTIWQFFRNCQISPKCQLHSHHQSICFEFLHILVKHLLVIVQSLSCIRLFVTPWTATFQASLVLHCFPEFAQCHVHWISEAIQPSHPLLSPSPTLNLSQHQGLFPCVSSSHQVAKVLELQLQHQSLQWIFRINFL